MAFSGVGKTDWEIRLGIENGIGCFNVESIPELEVINQLAGEMGKKAGITFRVNPDIDAHTDSGRAGSPCGIWTNYVMGCHIQQFYRIYSQAQ